MDDERGLTTFMAMKNAAILVNNKMVILSGWALPWILGCCE
jgi:hypothetical protein